MMELLSGLRQTKAELLATDKDQTISSMAFARKTLKARGLPMDEQRIILSSAGTVL